MDPFTTGGRHYPPLPAYSASALPRISSAALMEAADQRLAELDSSPERKTPVRSFAACLISSQSQHNPPGTAVRSERGDATHRNTTHENEIEATQDTQATTQAAQAPGRRQWASSIAFSDDPDGAEAKPVIPYKIYVTSYWEVPKQAMRSKATSWRRKSMDLKSLHFSRIIRSSRALQTSMLYSIII